MRISGWSSDVCSSDLRLKSQMSGVNEKSIQLDALEREATVNHNLLDQVMGRAKETIGQDRLQRPNGQLLSAAAPPNPPGFPPRFLILFPGPVGGHRQRVG